MAFTTKRNAKERVFIWPEEEEGEVLFNNPVAVGVAVVPEDFAVTVVGPGVDPVSPPVDRAVCPPVNNVLLLSVLSTVDAWVTGRWEVVVFSDDELLLGSSVVVDGPDRVTDERHIEALPS